MREPGDGLIRKALSARGGQGSGTCPDENLMAAYLEANLPPAEAARLESHFADCAGCREILALSMKLQAPGAENPQAVLPVSKKTLFRFYIPVPAIGALLVALVLIAALIRFAEKPAVEWAKIPAAGTKSTLPQVAESQPPAQKIAELHSEVPQPERAGKETAGKVMQPALACNRVVQPAVPLKKPISQPSALDKIAASEEKGKSEAEKRYDAPQPVAAASGARALSQSPLLGTASQKAVNAVAPDFATPPATPPAAAAGGAPQLSEPQSADAGTQNAFTPAIVQETVPRPHLYAAQNRIAVTHYTNPPDAAALRHAINALGVQKDLDNAEKREAGDRTFYKNSGFWIDKQCLGDSGAAIIEIAPDAPEYEEILKKYPDVRTIMPSAILWEGKIYLLK